ncbi:MAG: hypothetical protein ACLFS7_07400 [Desulfosudaceae bacterium]
MVYEGACPDRELAARLESLYSPRERVNIFAVFKLMLFSNMLVNTLTRPKYTAGAACSINPASTASNDDQNLDG